MKDVVIPQNVKSNFHCYTRLSQILDTDGTRLGRQYLHAVPVRDNPKLRTCMGTFRLHLRLSIFKIPGNILGPK